MIRQWLSISFCFVVGSAFGADEAEPVDRQVRLTEMRQRAEALKLHAGNKTEPLQVRAEPLFRYSDPARTTTDGTLWLWERNGQPLGAVCLFHDSREDYQWNYELVTMTEDPMVVDGRPGWNWTPNASKREWIKLSEPVIATAEFARLEQMKRIFDQFRSDENLDGDQTQLRSMPRPAYRYRIDETKNKPDHKVKDGALFLFAYGTNPEIIVQIEAIDSPDHQWRVGFARLASAELNVYRGDRKVWTAERVRQWNPKAEYFSHYGPDLVDEKNNSKSKAP